MSSSKRESGIPRRDLIRRAVMGSAAGTLFSGGAGLVHAAAAPDRASLPPGNGPLIVVSDSKAVAETASGKVRGYTHNGICTFKGIPYGAPTIPTGPNG